MASSSSSSTMSSKRKTTATLPSSSSSHASAAAATQQIVPLVFPGKNNCLSSFLEISDLLILTAVSKEMKDEYEGKLQGELRDVTLILRTDRHLPSFFDSARRFQMVQRLEIRMLDLSRRFLECIPPFFPLLQELFIRDGIRLDSLRTLAELIEHGALPLLKSFGIKNDVGMENGATAAIMEGFKRGGCPLLTTLEVPFLSIDEEQTERNLEALATAFEARAEAPAGTYEGLHKLGGDWLTSGSMEVRTRLLRTLLSSVRELPTNWKWNNGAFAGGVISLSVTGNVHLKFNFLAYAFSGGAFAGLETLTLYDVRGGKYGFANLCQGLEQTCAGTLTELVLKNCMVHGEGMQALGDLLARGALPCLKTFKWLARENGLCVWVAHLINGINAASRPLALTRLALQRTKMNDATFGVLMSAIENGRLPALEELELDNNWVKDVGFVALSETINAGHLGNLTKLDLRGNKNTAEGAESVFTALSAHCPRLQTLTLSGLEGSSYYSYLCKILDM